MIVTGVHKAFSKRFDPCFEAFDSGCLRVLCTDLHLQQRSCLVAFSSSKLESILVLNRQHCGTTRENGEVWQWLYLATRNVIWGISGGLNPAAGSLMVGYYALSGPCRVLEQTLTGCLG